MQLPTTNQLVSAARRPKQQRWRPVATVTDALVRQAGGSEQQATTVAGRGGPRQACSHPSGNLRRWAARAATVAAGSDGGRVRCVGQRPRQLSSR
eukprot:10804535-Alexandrium_andersonii.AAC.1